MTWQDEKPAPTPQSLLRKQEEINDTLALYAKTSEFKIHGPRKSGKTHALQCSLELKQPREHALVIITWATERGRWNRFIEEKKLQNTVIHTPDSLALYLINSWSRKESKPLEWVEEAKEEDINKIWLDSSSYAKALLSKKKITIGVAHWLLQNEIESFIARKMVPKADTLYLDEPKQWEPEAYSWIKHLPHSKRQTTEQTSLVSKLRDHTKSLALKGWVSKDKKVYNHRWIELMSVEPQNWQSYTLVTQHIEKTKKLVCKKRGIAMRAIGQTKGREYNKIWVDALPTNSEEKKVWGDKKTTLDKLDLVSSVCDCNCYTGPQTWDKSSIIPNKKENSNFLVWEI